MFHNPHALLDKNKASLLEGGVFDGTGNGHHLQVVSQIWLVATVSFHDFSIGHALDGIVHIIIQHLQLTQMLSTSQRLTAVHWELPNHRFTDLMYRKFVYITPESLRLLSQSWLDSKVEKFCSSMALP